MYNRLRFLPPLALLATLVFLAAACGDAASTGTPAAGLSGNLTIFAAASLTDAFNAEKQAFEATNPRVSITYNFAGSATLVTQLQQGAPADVLATAAQTNMDAALQDHSVVDGGTTFAKNKLAVIVPKDNPGHIATPFDLADAGLKLVLAEEGVPAGDYAREIFKNMEAGSQGGPGFAGKVRANVVSNEANVKAVVGKVQLGEADAGIVYVTDVTPDVAGDITLISIPDTLNVIATYPIAVTSNASHAGVAQAFIDFILSDRGQAMLEQNGFIRST